MCQNKNRIHKTLFKKGKKPKYILIFIIFKTDQQSLFSEHNIQLLDQVCFKKRASILLKNYVLLFRCFLHSYYIYCICIYCNFIYIFVFFVLIAFVCIVCFTVSSIQGVYQTRRHFPFIFSTSLCAL